MKPVRHQIITDDGSSTLRIEDLKETYHSRHGAVVESKFVYINKGFEYWLEKSPAKICRIMELGYGTGLMAYLTFFKFTESESSFRVCEFGSLPFIRY